MITIAAALALLLQDDLPKAPEGLQVREVVKLGTQNESNPTRVQVHPKTGLFTVLYLNGDLWQVDADKHAKKLVLEHQAYFRKDAAPFVQALGLYIDPAGVTYVVVNERHDEDTPRRAHVCVYRITEENKAEPWVEFDHPWGIGPFNHGACKLAIGPDGLMYLSVGSRTDHGEKGKNPDGSDSEKLRLDTHGETDVTACMLRWDPKADKPKPQVFCKGLRNSFGFDWDDKGRMIASENGPDADHPEELNWLREGKHYGFPYRFGNQAAPMYGDAAVAPEGLKDFEKPIANLGPAGRPTDKTDYTFHPHCSPSGVVFYRKGTLPAKYEGSFFVERFGNYLGKEPVGFDLLHVVLVEKDGELAAEMTMILEKLRRPIDLCLANGKLYILEYDSHDAPRPSRLLELAGK